MPPLTVLREPVGFELELIGLGDMKAILVASAVLPCGTARDDDEIGLLQSAHFLIEILEPVAVPERCPSR